MLLEFYEALNLMAAPLHMLAVPSKREPTGSSPDALLVLRAAHASQLRKTTTVRAEQSQLTGESQSVTKAMVVANQGQRP